MTLQNVGRFCPCLCAKMDVGDIMKIGDRIKKVRMDKNMTQEELGMILFVSSKTVSSWESNRTEPSLDIIAKLSKVFECPISYLMYGDEEKSDIETEIKIKLSEDEFNSLKDLLNDYAEFVSSSNQEDRYFQPKYRKFLKSGDAEIEEWLRIGIRGNKKILNYKHWYDNKYCDEYEVVIDDEENLSRIFNILDLEEIAVVNKTRSKYLYQEKYEFSLDYVKNLGYFVEIEVKRYDGTPLEEYDKLIELTGNFNLNLFNIDKRGYPYHIIYKD